MEVRLLVCVRGTADRGSAIFTSVPIISPRYVLYGVNVVKDRIIHTFGQELENV